MSTDIEFWTPSQPCRLYHGRDHLVTGQTKSKLELRYIYKAINKSKKKKSTMFRDLKNKTSPRCFAMWNHFSRIRTSYGHFRRSPVIDRLKSPKRPIVPTPIRTLDRLKYSSGGLVPHCVYDAANKPAIVFHQIQASGQCKTQTCWQVHPDSRDTTFWLK